MVGKIFRVIVAQSAAIRLRKIYSYYQKKASTKVANKVRNGLLAEARTLEKLPKSKPLLPIKKSVSPPHRYTRKWSYKIVFQVFENEDRVSIIDFLHDKESPDKRESL